MKKVVGYLFVVVIASGVSLAGGAAEASVVKMSIPDLLGDSDLVLQGKVTGAESRWADDGSIIVTDVTLSVQTEIFGDPGGAEVTVTIPGGQVGGVILEVSDTPSFRLHGEAVLFLTDGGPAGFEVTGAYQGKIDVVGGRVPAWGMPVEEFVDRIAVGGVGLDEAPAKPDNPGGGKGGGGGGGGDKGYKLLGLDWKANGEYDGVTWSPGNGGWYINNASSGFDDLALEGALLAATGTWDAVGANWAFGGDQGILNDPALDGALFDAQNTVSFADTGSSVATTYNWYYRYARRDIIETDLVFNNVDWTFGIDVCDDPDHFDLQNVAVHEFGHWLALDDQYGGGDTEKTMYGYVDWGECKKRDLWPSDEAGILAIYGP